METPLRETSLRAAIEGHMREIEMMFGGPTDIDEFIVSSLFGKGSDCIGFSPADWLYVSAATPPSPPQPPA